MDDIMIVGKMQNHRDHDIALTTLLETERKCNVKVNYDKLQYQKTEVDFFGKTYITDGHKSAQSKVSAIVEMPAPTCKKAGTVLHRHGQLLIKILSEIVRACRAH